MSKINTFSKRILDSIKTLEKKLVTYPVEERLKRARESYRDKAENREFIVVDKYGNRYYQYYSNQGLATKRIVLQLFYYIILYNRYILICILIINGMTILLW